MKKQLLALLVLVNSFAFATSPAPAKKTITTTTTTRTESFGDDTHANADGSKVAAGVELLGAGLLYSAFGTYRIIPMLAANLGLSYLSVSDTGTTSTASASLLSIPVSLSLLLGGKGGSNFEVLAGGVFTISSAKTTGTGLSQSLTRGGFAPQFGIGYRYWPTEGGFFFRGTLYGMIANSSFFPWFGITFGYAF